MKANIRVIFACRGCLLVYQRHVPGVRDLTRKATDPEGSVSPMSVMTLECAIIAPASIDQRVQIIP